MKSSSLKTNLSEIIRNHEAESNIITFVSEGATHAVNFNEEPHRKLAALNVSQCHILEITNRDQQRKRTVMSLSHFMIPHLIYERNIDASIGTVISNFILQGGDINNAEFRIYGGVQRENNVWRENLKNSINKILRNQYDIESVVIEEPRGHEVNKRTPSLFNDTGESIDYLFASDSVTFRKVTLSSIDENDESLDEVSKNLKDDKGKFDKGKVKKHQDFLDNEFKKVSFSLKKQIRKVEDDLHKGLQTLESIYERLKVENDQNKITELYKIVESQILTMSLKVCDKTGLLNESIQITEVKQLNPKQHSI
ncbi:MAG: hypothetical protein SFV53_03925 [Rickettsiales bacterium]|nr:hypothetical protein [Rickettsiales bacterium]